MMVRQEYFVLIERLLFDGFSPLLRFLLESGGLLITITIWGCVHTEYFACCGWWEELHFPLSVVLVDGKGL